MPGDRAFARRPDRDGDRVLVLLPGHDVVHDGVAAVVLGFERRRDEDRGTVGEEQEGREPLAAADREVGRPGEIGRGRDEEDVQPADLAAEARSRAWRSRKTSGFRGRREGAAPRGATRAGAAAPPRPAAAALRQFPAARPGSGVV